MCPTVCSPSARRPASGLSAPPPRRTTLHADSIAGILVLAGALALLVIGAAAEAGVAAASRAKLQGMARQGVPRAERLNRYANERASVLAVLALVRTVAAVVATGVGVYVLTRETQESWLTLGLAALGAIVAVTLLDTLARLLVARDPERWGIRLVPAVAAFRLVFGPAAFAVDRTLRSVVGAGEPEQPGDETDEILRLAEIDTNGDVIQQDEREMIRGIIELDETTAREIMAPRIDIVGLDVDATIEQAMHLIVERGFSRIPLYEETIDNILGIIYAKDLLRCAVEGRRPALRDLARPAYFIPESKRIDELLAELRQSKVHIAIVVDEYGGTAGLVTIEDLLEEIVGEIQDEYDREELPVERVTETEAILDARVSIDVLRELFGFALEDEGYDTVGGFVYHHLGKVPVAGDEVRVDGLTLRVLSVLGRRIKKVRATHTSEQPRSAATA